MTRAEIASKTFGLDDVDEQVLADYLAHRKKRKADVTATVVADLRKEAALAGLSVEGAMRLCIRRGWTGFDAAWVKGGDVPTAAAKPASRHSGFAAKNYREGINDDGSFA